VRRWRYEDAWTRWSSFNEWLQWAVDTQSVVATCHRVRGVAMTAITRTDRRRRDQSTRQCLSARLWRARAAITANAGFRGNPPLSSDIGGMTVSRRGPDPAYFPGVASADDAGQDAGFGRRDDGRHYRGEVP
jgi:hypothetical protein